MMYAGIKIVTILIIVSMSGAITKATDKDCIDTPGPIRMYGTDQRCSVLKSDYVMKRLYCRIPNNYFRCCASCADGCNDSKETKDVFRYKGRLYGCDDLLANSTFQSSMCSYVHLKDRCCASCKAPTGCHDRKKGIVFRSSGRNYSCKDLAKSSALQSKMCKNKYLKARCCNSCKIKPSG